MRECCAGTGDECEGYLLPAETMGEYETPKIQKKKSNPPKKLPGLFPLSEEGTYGPPPPYIRPLPGYTRRVATPKVYAAYSVTRLPVVKHAHQKKHKTSLNQRTLSENTTTTTTTTTECDSQSDTQPGVTESDTCFSSVRRREWTEQVTPSGAGLCLSYHSVQTVVTGDRGEIEVGDRWGRVARDIRQELEKVLEEVLEEVVEEGEQDDEESDICEALEDSIESEGYDCNVLVKDTTENSEREMKNTKNTKISDTIMLRKEAASTQEI